MGRAKLHHIPGFAWHITHRCHNRDYLLRFNRDKKRWLYWLFQAKKRYRLSILGFCLTSNHIHLLVHDDGRRESIPRSMLLAASCTAREYNRRKERSGAFWEDHYHATAVETGPHFQACLIYIELNMVRAGVVTHPRDWPFCSYREIASGHRWRRLVDLKRLRNLLLIGDSVDLRTLYDGWIRETLKRGRPSRESKWTENIAVGGKEFVDEIRSRLGLGALHRNVVGKDGEYVLKEPAKEYLHKSYE
jgi:putative transposase